MVALHSKGDMPIDHFFTKTAGDATHWTRKCGIKHKKVNLDQSNLLQCIESKHAGALKSRSIQSETTCSSSLTANMQMSLWTPQKSTWFKMLIFFNIILIQPRCETTFMDETRRSWFTSLYFFAKIFCILMRVLSASYNKIIAFLGTYVQWSKMISLKSYQVVLRLYWTCDVAKYAMGWNICTIPIRLGIGPRMIWNCSIWTAASVPVKDEISHDVQSLVDTVKFVVFDVFIKRHRKQVWCLGDNLGTNMAKAKLLYSGFIDSTSHIFNLDVKYLMRHHRILLPCVHSTHMKLSTLIASRVLRKFAHLRPVLGNDTRLEWNVNRL